MKRLLIAICIVVAVATFMSCKDSQAGTLWFAGSVVDSSTGNPIPGAKLVWNMNPGSKTIYTTPGGIYWFKGKNFCNTQFVAVFADGYYSQYRRVSDCSCWGCYEGCHPLYVEWGCRGSMNISFSLVKLPSASGMSQVIRPEAFYDNGELLKQLFGLYIATFCNRNVCNYDCLYQWVADIMNGPEYMFGHKTRPDIELPDCPDIPNFVDFVNDTLDTLWEYYYGDNFPDDVETE